MQHALALLIQITNKSWLFFLFFINHLQYASVRQMATLYEAEAWCSLGRSAGDWASGYQPFWAAHFALRWLQRKICVSTHLFNETKVSFKNIKKCHRKLRILCQTPVIQKASLLLSEFRQLQRNPNAKCQKWAMDSHGLSHLYAIIIFLYVMSCEQRDLQ